MAEDKFELRDPVHRTVVFSEAEKKVIDHPYIQRLRYVRQLGLAYLVYPGATHDRFSHGLGVMHVAGRLWDGMMATSGGLLAARYSADDLAAFRRLVRLAGLTHDLGHPPFSHVAEKFLPPLADLAVPTAWWHGGKRPQRPARHEDYSVALLAALAEEGTLDAALAQDAASLVHHEIDPSPAWVARRGQPGQGLHALLRSLISSELDADRMDYLLRDAHYTGVAYGNYDLDHLVANTGLTEVDGEIRRTIDDTAVRAFEDFLLARYHMFLQVYLHKTTLGFDYYLEQAGLTGEVDFTLPGEAAGYARLSDSTLRERLTAAAEAGAPWSRRLVRREPAKLLMAASYERPEELAVLDRVAAALKEAGLAPFRVNSRQYLAKREADGDSLLVRRHLLGRTVFEPVERYSRLLNRYNEVIDLTHLYVLREEYDRAQAVIAKLPLN